MNKHIVAEIIGGVVILGLLGLIGWDQYEKAVGNGIATATAKIQQEADKKIADGMKARDDQYAKDRAADHADVAAARASAEKMAAFVNRAVPSAPSPIQVHTGPLETVTLHTGDAVIPAESSTAFFDTFAAGNTCTTLDLPKCKADLVDWQARYQAKSEEAAQWEKAAKGGSWLKRLKNDAIKIGIGVGVGYAIKH